MFISSRRQGMCRPTRSLWLIAALAAACGCAVDETPQSAQTKKYRPADDAASAPAATDVALVPDPDAGQPGVSNTPTSSPPTGYKAPAAFSGGVSPPATSTDPPAREKSVATQGVDASVQELTTRIDLLARQRPKGNTQEEQIEDFIRTQQQRLADCRKVLALNPDAATRGSIYRAMFEIYGIFDQQLRLPGARTQFLELAKSAAADADPAVARLGRHTLFNMRLMQLASQGADDGQAIVAEVRSLLEGDKGSLDEQTLSLAAEAVEPLMQSGFTNDAAAVLELLAAAAAADPKQAEQAAKYVAQAKLVKADLGTLLSDILTDQPQAETKLVEAVKTLMAELEPSRELFANMQQVVMILEATGHFEAAKSCLDLIDAEFQEVNDERLAATVKLSLEGARKRMSLAGQPFVVEGVTLDGKPFDWSAYAGKVVLVDFWATWCGPCLEELPNIRRNFEQFQAMGFEVVGVNLDTDLDNVKQFFSVHDLPWVTVTSQIVVDGKASEDFSQLPMAAKCGVDGIPFLVLVGKDGKVDSLHVRGPKLKARLTQLLGEPMPSPVPADPTAPAPAGEKPAPAAKTGALVPRGAALPVALLLAQASMAADPPAQPPPTAEDPAINPYQAKPGLPPAALVEYILKMLDKPQTIQRRAGFAESIVEACDRVLAADPPAQEIQQLVAAETKFQVLHREACDGKEAADKQLLAFVEQMAGDARPRIAKEIAFLKLERRAIEAAQGPLEAVPALLQELQDYLAQEKLTARHLRLASSTVALINRLADGDVRERHFTQFGGLFAKSSDKELARYGKKLAKPPASQESDLVGQTLELTGTTAKGGRFVWESYRGKVVLVDFWATWCGPCLREMPHVQAFFDKHHEAGFEVVGVSLDEDQDALADYLADNAIPWETLAGDQTQELAQKYGVRAIPTMMLVDRQGKIVGVAHNLDALAPLAEKLLK